MSRLIGSYFLLIIFHISMGFLKKGKQDKMFIPLQQQAKKRSVNDFGA
jgi:hypothetical protein